MAQKSLREIDGKALISKYWHRFFPENLSFPFRSVYVNSGEDLLAQVEVHPWLTQLPLVAKPDMGFGNRGLNGLVFMPDLKNPKPNLKNIAAWIDEKSEGITVLKKGAQGQLTAFIVEPFIAHEKDTEEAYICATTEGENDILYLSRDGGVGIENKWDKVLVIPIPIDCDQDAVHQLLEDQIPPEFPHRDQMVIFASGFYQFFKRFHFTYLEINPIVFQKNNAYILDLVGKIDDTAQFLMAEKWGELSFPTPFGQTEQSPEEQFIASIDAKSGASLKLTLLNPDAPIWTLVAGGGASVAFADTIADRWGIENLANYGEYSGNPSTDETFQYARTVIDLMTRKPDPKFGRKILLIGGAIANFTDVAKTFKGIVQAFEEMADKMKAVNTHIYVRRGGPNDKVGLQTIKEAAEKLGLPIEIHGAEAPMTDIVRESYEAVETLATA